MLIRLEVLEEERVGEQTKKEEFTSSEQGILKLFTLVFCVFSNYLYGEWGLCCTKVRLLEQNWSRLESGNEGEIVFQFFFQNFQNCPNSAPGRIRDSKIMKSSSLSSFSSHLMLQNLASLQLVLNAD